MMAAQIDLWGTLIPEPHRTPVAILREQAALLGTKTEHLIEAEVTTSIQDQRFVHGFDIVVPGLDGYRYQLFRISHGPEIYPVDVRFRTGVLSSEDEFVAWLGEKLSSKETKHLINNLLSQTLR